MNTILTLKDISLTYHTKQNETLALRDLTFGVGESEFISLVGPSGCGKTTILSLVAGILKPTSGEIELKGEKITKPTTRVGYMFQRDNLFEWLNIYKNVTIGLTIQHKNTKENQEKVNALLEKYGLSEFKKYHPNQLSGGMRQRVALIRTLATDPEILLLDEPFSALDYQTRLNVQDNVYEIIKSEKKTAILVTHDISEAIAMSDKVIVLTSRPAKVKKIIELDFDKSLTPFERRKDEKFHLYFNEIWEELTWKKFIQTNTKNSYEN